MKPTIWTLAVVLSLGLYGNSQGPRSVPSSIQHAQELQTQNERDFPAISPRVDPAALKQEVDQLADLAASIRPDVQKAGKGLLSKDLVQKLRQIEKLSKHLRNELTH